LLGHDDAVAVETFHEALGEWGDREGQQPREPLTGLDGRWLLGYRQSLLLEHRAARDACWQAELRLGRHDQLIPPLFQQVQANPADENLVGMLMVAYYRVGRQPEATTLYRDTRRRLDEVGIRPSGELERIHQLVLQQDASLDPPRQRLAVAASGPAAAPDPPPAAAEQATRKAKKRKKRHGGFGPISIGGHGAVVSGSVQDLHIGDTVHLGHGGQMSGDATSHPGRPT
jgi:hypothetical protein